MPANEQIIEETKDWINKVVIGCNFCPFASRVVNQQKVLYQVETSATAAGCLDKFMQQVTELDNDDSIQTSFLIFPNGFGSFADYLSLVDDAEKLLKKKGYNGIYQVASFHPLYLFADAAENDAANYTNRSMYPMLHLLRESSIDKALEHYADPESIPEKNVDFARKKGIVFMKMLRDSCAV